MKKNLVLITVAAFSVSFFACKEEILSIAAPAAPVLPSIDNIELPPPPSDIVVATPDPAPPAPVAAPTPAPAPVIPAATFMSAGNVEQLSSGRYTIQIAVFPSEASAKALVKRMSDNGINAYYTRVNNPAQLLGTYYRVRVGYFNGKSAAENFAETRLRPLGYAWWVDGSRNDAVGNPAGRAETVAATNPKLEQAKEEYRQIAREAARETAREAVKAAAAAPAQAVQAPPPQAPAPVAAPPAPAPAAPKPAPPPPAAPAPAQPAALKAPPPPAPAPAPAPPQAAATREVEVNSRGQVKILNRN
ncbi:MAG: SPOR domain-containing protein [Fibromonadaceae bacterium]|nr:SPOR domain-containing protein [Fibromonadaceae bacterium]